MDNLKGRPKGGNASRTLREVFGRVPAKWVVRNGEIQTLRPSKSSQTPFTGPGELEIQLGHAVILEKNGKISRILPAGVHLIVRDERIGMVVPLYGRSDSVVIRDIVTRDGLIIEQLELKIFHKVKVDEAPTHQHDSRFPYSEDILRNLVWSASGTDWSAGVRGVTEREARNLISDYTLQEFMTLNNHERRNFKHALDQRVNAVTTDLMGINVVLTGIGTIRLPSILAEKFEERLIADTMSTVPEPATWDQIVASTNMAGNSAAMPGNTLTPSQRRHLEQEYSELQRRYDSLSRSIAALDTDISRTLEEYRRQPLEERRAERAAEREQVASRMAQIETDLGMVPSSQPAAEPAKATPGATTQPDQLFGRGNRWAVLIGVNSYEDAMHYGPLQVCVQDVEATREALLAGGFDPARIRLLTDNTDEKPARANILAALQSVASATERDDLLLVYYSGHGDAAGGESYLVARDGRHLVLGDTAVSVTRVKQIVEAAPARAKVLLLDACHSGADIGQKGPQPMTPEFIQRVFEQAEGMAILASCKQGQVSYEWRLRQRSVFTHFLLEALAGAADRDSKGFITVQDANRHVANGVKLWASQRNLSQTPTLQYSVAGDIILTESRQRDVKREA